MIVDPINQKGNEKKSIIPICAKIIRKSHIYSYFNSYIGIYSKIMHELTYISKANIDCSSQEIEHIFERSRMNNETLNITGCLIFHKKTFIQILEGAKKDLEELYYKISTDSRHHDVTLKWEGPSEKREFKGWNMARLDSDSYSSTSEIYQFEQNLLLLSSLSKRSSACLGLFWNSVEELLLSKDLVAKTF